MQVDDPEVESVVESRLDKLLEWLASKSESVEVAVRLSFYERRTKQTFGWFGGATEERLYWEQWRVPLRVHRAPGAEVASSLKGAVERSVFFVLSAVNDKREHIPPVSATSSGAVSHPFEIGLPGDATTGVALKRLVTSARPPVNVL